MANAQILAINTRENKVKGKGHAIISITGQNLTGPSLSFYIKRNGVDKPYLGQGGWQVADATLKPDAVTEIEGGLELYVGPNVVAYMENSNFILGLTNEGSSEIIEATMFWENVRPVKPVIKPGRPGGPFGPRAGKKTVKPDIPSPVPPAPEPEPEPLPTIEPPTEPPPPIAKEEKSKKGMVIGIITFLILAAAGGGYWLYEQSKTAEPINTAEDNSAAQKQDADEEKSAPVKQDPRKRVEYAKQNMSPEQLYQEGLIFLEEAKQSQNKDLIAYAESLFRAAGDRDYALGYLAIGKIYDPKGFSADRSTQLQAAPDKAYHYYNMARETGTPAAEEHIKRVRKWVEQQAEQGDPAAQKLLRTWLGEF